MIADVQGTSKRYGAVQALTDVSFSIEAGEVRGLLGKNGAGKSTLIRMLSGAEEPDSGTVSLAGTVVERPSVNRAQELGVRTVYQELTVIPALSIAENIYIGAWPTSRGVIDRRSMRDGAVEALGRIGVRLDPGRVVGELSIADQQMVEIARAMFSDPGLLILDEPTSSLAAAEVDRVLGAVEAIQTLGVAVIYVSHRLPEVRRVAGSATIMRDGRVVDTVSMTEYDNRALIDLMVGSSGAEDALVSQARSSGPVVLDLHQVTLAPKLVDVSLEVRRGEVLGIAGVLGSGRSEILQVAAGLRRADRGEVTVNGLRVPPGGWRAARAAGIGYTPEDRKNDGIVPDLGIDENTVLTDWKAVSRAGVVDRGRVATATRRIVDAMSVKAAKTSTPISNLSGGNQQKVVIGRWLHAGSSVLLLDEPTRGVDVQAKAQIYRLLRELADDGKAVVFVSSEMDELNLVCDRVVVLRDGRIVAEHSAPAIETDELLRAAISEAS